MTCFFEKALTPEMPIFPSAFVDCQPMKLCRQPDFPKESKSYSPELTASRGTRSPRQAWADAAVAGEWESWAKGKKEDV